MNLDENTNLDSYCRRHGAERVRTTAGPRPRAPACGSARPALSRGGGPVDGADRRPPRLGRSPATIKAYFYDPTGEKARAVKARYQGVWRGCGADTQPRNGKGDAYAYCKACRPGAIERKRTKARILAAMHAWRWRYGSLPSSYD
jgi:hypothetical protein